MRLRSSDLLSSPVASSWTCHVCAAKDWAELNVRNLLPVSKNSHVYFMVMGLSSPGLGQQLLITCFPRLPLPPEH
eukprot:m.180784 g.180784  ORF g.180784 m.180784 type:complete len:75 (+) comp16864_c0_seq1:503-727(+)